MENLPAPCLLEWNETAAGSQIVSLHSWLFEKNYLKGICDFYQTQQASRVEMWYLFFGTGYTFCISDPTSQNKP